jgi:hypothetical protein
MLKQRGIGRGVRNNEKHAAPESGLQAVDTNACCQPT